MGKINKVKLGDILKPYRIERWVNDNEIYKQVTITKDGSVFVRGEKVGSEIGRKRQFVIDLETYPNTLLFIRQTIWDGGIGIASKEVHGCIVTENFPMFSISDKVLPGFLLHFFRTFDFIQKLSKISTKGSAQQALHERDFLKIELDLPDLSTQKSIVARLHSFQSLHREADATLARLKADVKRLRQSILQDAIQGKLIDYQPEPGEKTGAALLADIRAEKERRAREAGKKTDKPLPPVTPEEMPFALPEGWVWCRLGDVADVIDPNPSHRMPDYVITGVPFISTDNFNSDKTIDFHRGKKVSEITLQEHIQRYEISDTSFAFSRIGTIGKTVKLPTSRNYCLSHSLSVITPPPQSINSDYLQLVMSSEFILIQAANGVRSISVPDLGMARIRQFLIPLPTIIEQSKIFEVVNNKLLQFDQFDQQIAALQSKMQRLWKSELQQTFQFESNG